MHDLGPDVDGSPVWHEFPDFVHLRIRHCDTSVRPVPCSMSGTQPSEAVREAMNHDVAPRP